MKGNPFMCWNGKLKVFSTMFTYVGGVLFDKKDKNNYLPE